MRLPGRVQAAIEVLEQITVGNRTARAALVDWGRSHRFAGSSDRAAIGNLVYDALRHKASLSARMENDSPRALVFGTLTHLWDMAPDAVIALCGSDKFAPAPLSNTETIGLRVHLPATAPVWVRADIPEWLVPAFEESFAGDVIEQGHGLADRAPIDLRVNSLKTTREKLLPELAKFGAQHTPYAPCGIRLPPRHGSEKAPNMEAETAYQKGWFELQDEGSQLAAFLCDVGKGQQIADICAGAGGKTLALAAQSNNSGQIYAFDRDKRQLRPIHDRLKRAGVRNTQVLSPGKPHALPPLAGKMDRVLVDAPCSGSGTWRRHPDAKWRLTAEDLEARLLDQRNVLELAAPLVKSGGRLIYITCSVLRQENTAQIEAFLQRHPDFEIRAYEKCLPASIARSLPPSADGGEDCLLLTPASHGTDGFFIAVLETP